MTTPTPKQYRLPDLGDLTLNDAYVIKVKTGVDIMRPPTVAHADAALLWYVAKDDETPLVFTDLLAMTLENLSDLIADADEGDAQSGDDEPDPQPDREDVDRPKASTNSPDNSPDSPDTGAAPQPI